MTVPLCEFYTLEDRFNFGRYKGLCISDVLDTNPSYIDWCVKHCTGVVFRLYDEIIIQIKAAYPLFKMDHFFEEQRIFNLNRNTHDELHEEDDDNESDFYDIDNDWISSPKYERYGGSWAQDVENFSDDDIDTIFDGDPSAYCNID